MHALLPQRSGGQLSFGEMLRQLAIMTRSTVPVTALAITFAGVMISLVVASQQLPLRVASHFNSAGTPDGWMLRNSYLWSMAGIAFGMTVSVVGAFYSVRFFSPSLINLPHRDYWLAPERREETFAVILRAGVWLATLQAAFFLGIHLLVVAANASHPVRLSSHVWFLLVANGLVTIIWTFFLIQRFRRVA
jgi:serine/threonine-protein kinase